MLAESLAVLGEIEALICKALGMPPSAAVAQQDSSMLLAQVPSTLLDALEVRDGPCGAHVGVSWLFAHHLSGLPCQVLGQCCSAAACLSVVSHSWKYGLLTSQMNEMGCT